jgi:4,5-DOPA dioxygenase extradiol
MTRLPTVFISHGAPDTAIADTQAARFLSDFASQIERPRAIVVASAHFEVDGQVAVSADAQPETIHDFGGFDRRLYEMSYKAPGHPQLARRIVDDLRSAGFDARTLSDRGYDHGTWVPLTLMYPEADIHLALGRALAALRDEGILVIGSGSFTHNLGEAFKALRVGDRQAAMPAWVAEFVSWMDDRIVAGDAAALAAYRKRAPHAAANHPTEEHLMPLYVAIGAAGESWTARKLHTSHEFGVLSMDAYAFD